MATSRSAIRLVRNGARFQSSRVGVFGSEPGQNALNEELPNVPHGSYKPQTAQKTIISTLLNGLTVAARETHGEAATIAFSVAAGSRYETSKTQGISQLVEKIAFKSTEKRSHLRFVRDLEDIGAVVSAKGDREAIVYTVEVMRKNVNAALVLLAETIIRPNLTSWQIDEFKESLALDLEDVHTSPQAVLTEAILAAAYGDSSPLGRSMYPSSAGLHRLGAEDAADFRSSYFGASRSALVAIGVDPAEFADWANDHFADFTSGSAVPSATDLFVGGESRVSAESNVTYLALALQAPGTSSKDFAASQVLKSLLGWNLSGAAAFTAPFANTGLIGAYAAVSGGAEDVSAALSNITAALKAAAAAPASDDVFARAAIKARASAVSPLDTRSALAGSIAKSLLVSHAAPDAAAVNAAFATVTSADVQRVAAAALASPVALASVGDISIVPSVRNVQSLLR